MRLPRTECSVCGRDVAVSIKGLTWRHDPAGGRDPELRSCAGSLKPVAPPEGQAVLFVSVDDEALEDAFAMPEPAGLF